MATTHYTPTITPTIITLGIAFILIYFYSIPFIDLLFCICYPIYIYLANKITFNSNVFAIETNHESVTQALGKGMFDGNKTFFKYMIIATTIGLLLPLLYIIMATTITTTVVTTTTTTSIDSSIIIIIQQSGIIPPLVTLLFQVATENATFKFHDVPRILIPIGFNTFRLQCLITWVVSSYDQILQQQQQQQQQETNDNNDYTSSSFSSSLHIKLLYFGFIISIINMIFWTNNLFCILLIRILPAYFDKTNTPEVECAYTLIPIAKKHNKLQIKKNE